jgi:hypothetical protein
VAVHIKVGQAEPANCEEVELGVAILRTGVPIGATLYTLGTS